MALTLAEWRELNVADTVGTWASFRPFFIEHGITLFTPSSPSSRDGCILKAPNDKPRVTETGLHVTLNPPERRDYLQRTGLAYPAVLEDGQWVLVRVVSKGDEGASHRQILQFLCSKEAAFDHRNRCLAPINMLRDGDWTFAVFAMWDDLPFHPWFYDLAEVFDFMEQTLECLSFLHSNLIVHRDIKPENLIVNHVGLRTGEGEREKWLQDPPDPLEAQSPAWRSKFPVSYAWIDFELSQRFPPGSDRSKLLITGPPSSGFVRPSAPEVFGSAPYDPFCADVFATGLMYWIYFRQYEYLAPGMIALFDSMLHVDASKRPAASAALAALYTLRSSISIENLHARLPRSQANPETPHPHARTRSL